MSKKITLFTVNLIDNDFLNTPLHQFCIKSWQKLIDYYNSIGYEATIRIFNYDDQEVIDFKEDCKIHWLSKSSLAEKADAFRFYILSKYENYMWLDADVYIRNPKEFIDLNEMFVRRTFWLLYNASNLSFFRDIYNQYREGKFIKKCDYMVFFGLGLQEKFHAPSGAIHLFFIDNYDNIYLIEKTNEFILKNRYNRKEYIFISEKDLKIDQIHSLKEDKELIEFVKTHYELKKEV